MQSISAVHMSRVPGKEIAQRLDMAVQGHYNHVEACFELIASIESMNEERPKLDMSFSDHLNAEQKSDFNELLVEAATILSNAVQTDSPQSMEISGEGRDPEAYAAFAKVFWGAGTRVSIPSRSQLIQKSVLILLVVGFETLLTDLATVAIKKNPGIANLDSHTLTLAELRELGSIEEAADFLVSGYVEDLARGSLEDWVKWFAKAGVKLDEIPAEWIVFREIFARRNLLVHTDGRVSQQYLDTLADCGAGRGDLPAVKASLGVTPAYLKRSSELLLSVGVLLSTSLTMKLAPESSEAAINRGISFAERALEDGHTEACTQICRTIADVCRNRMDLVTSCRLKTLEWTAQALQGDEDAVAAKALAWDTRGVDLLYSHIRTVLMKEDEKALQEIVNLVESKRLARLTVLKSPIYKSLRDRIGPRMREVLGIQPATELPSDEQVGSVAALKVGLDTGVSSEGAGEDHAGKEAP